MQLDLDQDGYLRNLSDWSPKTAEQLALSVHITMSSAHWEVIELLRQFYAETGVSPAMRILVKLVKKNLGPEKGNSIYLLTLFPDSPAKLAAKIAGLPRPTNCI
ncbi:MAG: TusE/DsrC/DsvC family sulfur relay protein [Gammaproteobacteria bacterium]|jgi:tRNA 2-thiouridine synthesizing protein E|nr:TusE/DsrC/DsvC family sulfur relay protein [Gammaproteobacteria bacterium]